MTFVAALNHLLGAFVGHWETVSVKPWPLKLEDSKATGSSAALTQQLRALMKV
jgi:hypothetical protein